MWGPLPASACSLNAPLTARLANAGLGLDPVVAVFPQAPQSLIYTQRYGTQRKVVNHGASETNWLSITSPEGPEFLQRLRRGSLC